VDGSGFDGSDGANFMGSTSVKAAPGPSLSITQLRIIRLAMPVAHQEMLSPPP